MLKIDRIRRTRRSAVEHSPSVLAVHRMLHGIAVQGIGLLGNSGSPSIAFTSVDLPRFM